MGETILTTPEKLHDLLSSLAPISTADYQIRSAEGELLFTTNGDGSTVFPPDAFRQVTRQVIDDNAFSYHTAAPHMYLCGCPIAAGEQTPTALLAYGPTTQCTDPGQHRKLLQNHLSQTVSLIEENHYYQAEVQELALQLEHSFEDLYLYSHISNQVKSLTLSKQMLNNIMVEILENMQVDAAFVTLPQRPQFDMEIYHPAAKTGPGNWELLLNQLQEPIRRRIQSAQENYIIINDSRQTEAYRQLATQPYRLLAVGVHHQGDPYGWIGLVSFNLKEIFRQGELRILKSLTEQLAIVIANTDLYKNLEQFTVNMVRSLVYAIEAKDPYTSGHSERVYHFSMLMAQRLGIENDAFEALKWAAILHDVGKIGISEQILLKPGKLTDEEFGRIKEHPEKGGRILQPVAQLANSLGGIVHHHERYDGKGYPYGLKGEEIPLAARIIAVADTFDAITSSRTYRQARTRREAMQIIKSVAGTQLDPKIVKIFEQVYAQEPAQTP